MADEASADDEDPLSKVTVRWIDPNSEEAKQLAAQWDEEYMRPKKQADVFREMGIPPPPRPQPREEPVPQPREAVYLSYEMAQKLMLPWDEEYDCSKQEADDLRKRGLPPFPKW